MIYVFLALIIDPKIINNQGKGDGLRRVFPKSQSILALILTVRGEMLLQELVCKEAGLGETQNSLVHLEVNIPANDFVQ